MTRRSQASSANPTATSVIEIEPPLMLEQEVPAGNVLAIGGLDTAILKSATLSSSPAARPLAPMLFQVQTAPQLA